MSNSDAIMLFGTIGFFLVFPILLMVGISFAVSRLGWKFGGLAIVALFVFTRLGFLFMGLPLLIGFVAGGLWFERRQRSS